MKNDIKLFYIERPVYASNSKEYLDNEAKLYNEENQEKIDHIYNCIYFDSYSNCKSLNKIIRKKYMDKLEYIPHSMYFILLDDLEKYAKSKNKKRIFNYITIWRFSRLFDIYSDILTIEGIGEGIYLKKIIREKDWKDLLIRAVKYNGGWFGGFIDDIKGAADLEEDRVKEMIDLSIELDFSSNREVVLHNILKSETLDVENEKLNKKLKLSLIVIAVLITIVVYNL
ncbi:hypothetical protein [Fusobacterium sp. IOR10]|uniref:hypothetical protein n=1 Tax=Fusobacterium sp. IOR10 TaxID=2665157 RepID=UPI0013D6C2A0|nr:hypothetical protein [Fusobacterium sp. IOR10]